MTELKRMPTGFYDTSSLDTIEKKTEFINWCLMLSYHTWIDESKTSWTRKTDTSSSVEEFIKRNLQDKCIVKFVDRQVHNAVNRGFLPDQDYCEVVIVNGGEYLYFNMNLDNMKRITEHFKLQPYVH